MSNSQTQCNVGFSHYFSVLSYWALAFGCVIGWGSFVMPGTMFLPEAGSLGTSIGLLVSTFMILVTSFCYIYLIKENKNEFGSYAIIRKIIGDDHAFLAVWALIMAYLSLLWANATAFMLVGRYFFGDLFQFGFHYIVAGYDVYAGEVLATNVIFCIFGLFVGYASKIARATIALLAVILLISVIALFLILVTKNGFGIENLHFAQNNVPHFAQILDIAILAPWLFVGFEVVTNVQRTSDISRKNLYVILSGSIIAGMLVYILLALIGAIDVPNNLSPEETERLSSMPVLYNVKSSLGDIGYGFLGLAIFSTLSTSVLGFFFASARIINIMAQAQLLPAKIIENNEKISIKAIWLAIAISVPITFLGRTAVGWNADVSTLAVAIVYVYISVCTFLIAKRNNNLKHKIIGIVGMVTLSLVFLLLLVPNIFTDNGLATESYLMLAGWSLVGIVYYWVVFRRDQDRRFGKSTIMWIMMLFLLFFSTNVWLRLYQQDQIDQIIGFNSSDIKLLLLKSSVIQMVVVVIALFVLFSLFATMLKRERKAEKERIEANLKRKEAEDNSKAKSIFLSNMSHDIRTPMNAIIGYVNIAKDESNNEKDLREYLSKIENSSQHLLALINDVLEMSRIESGKMDLEPIPVDLKKTLDEVKDMFSTQMSEKKINFTVEALNLKQAFVYCDKNRFNRVLLNLLSNAYKFTPEGGSVSVTMQQLEDQSDDLNATYELRVKDSGIGMTKEFAAKVFEAFERERNSTVSGIQGTGLGMAITKSIIDLMGGDIKVITAPNEGTQFVITIKFKLLDQKDLQNAQAEKIKEEQALHIDFSKMRLLLVEDMKINREIAKKLLSKKGFTLDTAENGQEALDQIKASKPGYYDAVLMDIQMPVMDGYEATKQIRQLENKDLANIPIIAMTANAFSEDIKKSHDLGMNGHVAKPINMDELLKTISDIISTKEN